CRTPTRIVLCSTLTRHAVIHDDPQVIASAWDNVKTLDLYWAGWSRLFHVLTEFVQHTTYTTEGIAHDDGITHAQSTALNDNGSNRTATTVKVSFNGNALCIHVWVRSQLKSRVSGENYCFQQRIDVGPGLSRDIYEHGVATIFFWN